MTAVDTRSSSVRGPASRSSAESIQGTARALGFQPALATGRDEWRSVSMAMWHGRTDVPCNCAPFRDLVLGFHTGGAALRVQLDGRWLDGRTRPGTVTITPPGTPVTWDISGELQSCTLHLAPERFANLIREQAAEDLLRQIEFAFAAEDAVLSGALTGLIGELREPTANGSLYVDALADAVSLHLLCRKRRIPDTSTNHGCLPRYTARRVIDRIESAIEAGVSLEELATLAGLSRTHFSRCFRASYGTSPHQYLKRRRLERAKWLLQATGKELAVIGTECGFASQSHFSDAFKSTTGITPRVFRDTSQR